MKPPVLRIKKGSIVYDDTGAQQQGEPWRPSFKPRPSRRAARGRRAGPRYSMVPLLVIALGLFVLFRVALPRLQANRAVLAGWQVTLRLTPWEDSLVVGLTFASRSARPAAAPALARVHFAGSADAVLIAGDLERSPITLTGRLPRAPAGTVVQAEVEILGARAMLSARVPRPPPR